MVRGTLLAHGGSRKGAKSKLMPVEIDAIVDMGSVTERKH